MGNREEELAQIRERISACGRGRGRRLPRGLRTRIAELVPVLRDEGWSWSRISAATTLSTTTLSYWRQRGYLALEGDEVRPERAPSAQRVLKPVVIAATPAVIVLRHPGGVIAECGDASTAAAILRAL